MIFWCNSNSHLIRGENLHRCRVIRGENLQTHRIIRGENPHLLLKSLEICSIINGTTKGEVFYNAQTKNI